jgi:hypothetical protein
MARTGCLVVFGLFDPVPMLHVQLPEPFDLVGLGGVPRVIRQREGGSERC